MGRTACAEILEVPPGQAPEKHLNAAQLRVTQKMSNDITCSVMLYGCQYAPLFVVCSPSFQVYD